MEEKEILVCDIDRLNEMCAGFAYNISLFFTSDYFRKHTKEELIDKFKKIEWDKYSKSLRIRFYRSSVFLAEYLSPHFLVVDLNLDVLHDVQIISENIRELNIELTSTDGFDSTFFERLPVSIEKITLEIKRENISIPVDPVFRNGFHNLPPFLKHFEIIFVKLKHVNGDAKSKYFCSGGLDEIDLEECFTFGPYFKTLKVNEITLHKEKE